MELISACFFALTLVSMCDSNVLLKARCVFPNGLDHITRAALFQQCISSNAAQGNETVCYEELGCFEMEYPWVSPLRPMPSPNSPAEIDVKIRYFSRNVLNGVHVNLWPQISLNKTDFNAKRSKTVFIVHGFANNGYLPWLSDMKDAYLKKVDANVFLVDWGNGAQQLNYLQVASNTRIVGAELNRFVNFLVSNGQEKSALHLIGHSLGAHISAYLAKGFKGNGKVGRITGLDPAQPGFEGEHELVRLDKEDANFVDVVHTHAQPFALGGLGIIHPVGHVDFYMNGGNNQPGCELPTVPEINSVEELSAMPVEMLLQWFGCSHGRAIPYFIASLNLDNCTFWGRKMTDTETYFKLLTGGAIRPADTLVKSLIDCTSETCIPLGLDTPKYPLRGIFDVATSPQEPYCQTTTLEERAMKSLLNAAVATTSNLFSIFTNPIF